MALSEPFVGRAGQISNLFLTDLAKFSDLSKTNWQILVRVSKTELQKDEYCILNFNINCYINIPAIAWPDCSDL